MNLVICPDKIEGVDISITMESEKCNSCITATGDVAGTMATVAKLLDDGRDVLLLTWGFPHKYEFIPNATYIYMAGSEHVNDRNKSFDDAVKPVIKWLNDNANPHATIIVEYDNAVLYTGELTYSTNEFIKD